MQNTETKRNLLLLREQVLNSESAIVQCEPWYNRYVIDMCQQYGYVIITFNCENTDVSMV